MTIDHADCEIALAYAINDSRSTARFSELTFEQRNELLGEAALVNRWLGIHGYKLVQKRQRKWWRFWS